MKKKYIILLIILVVYLIVTFLLFYDGKPVLGNKTNKKDKIEYVYFSNNQLWKYDGEKFQSSYNETEVFGDKKFYIYENGTYKGRYTLGLYETTLYLFDDDNNSVSYQGELTGFTDTKNHNVINLENQNLISSDKENIKMYFEKNKLDYNDLNLNIVYKYLADLDSDGDFETVYDITNMFDEEKKSKGYSLIFAYDNGKIYELIKDIKANSKSFTDGYEYHIKNIADLDNDGFLDFIISKSNYGSPKICYLLMQKERREYKVTKSC